MPTPHGITLDVLSISLPAGFTDLKG